MMRKTTLSNQSNPAIVAVTVNVANVRTPVLTATTPRGATYLLHNKTQVRGQLQHGTYLILDLNKADGTRISGASKITIATRGPSDEFEKFRRTLPYSIWRDLSSVQQRNEDFKGTIISQADLNTGDGIVIPEAYQLLILVDSPDQIDWSKSYAQFDVEERN